MCLHILPAINRSLTTRVEAVVTQLQSWDIAQIDAYAQGNRALRRALIQRRLSTDMDVDKSFCRHLRYVPRSFLDSHPSLWTLPGFFARYVYTRCTSHEEQLFLVQLVKALVENAYCLYPYKTRESTVLIFCKTKKIRTETESQRPPYAELWLCSFPLKMLCLRMAR